MGERALCRSVGRGKDLVLIHGWRTTPAAWTPLVEVMRDAFRLHLIRLPGHGDDAPARVSLAKPAPLIAAIREATPENAVWVGWSLGGVLGLLAARSGAPRRLVCAAASLRLTNAPGWSVGMPRGEYADFVRRFDASPARAAKHFAGLSLRGDRRAAQAGRYLKTGESFKLAELRAGLKLLDSDLRASARVRAARLLFIAGGKDRIVSPACVRASAELLGASYGELAHAGHALCISHAHEFARIVARFVDETADEPPCA